MNWEAIGTIGEILGAFVVIVTLFYLAMQIRQNTKAQSIATFESAMSGFNEVIRYSMGDIKYLSTTSIFKESQPNFSSRECDV